MSLTTHRAVPTAALILLAASIAAAPVPGGTGSDPGTTAALKAVAAESTLTGNVVYVDFWASWCIPCRQSFPWMSSMLGKYYQRGLRVVTINLDKNPAAGRKFMREMKTALPVAFDSTGALARTYKLEVMPTSFIYGRDGKLRSREEGFHPDRVAGVEATIDALLKESR